MDAKPRYFFSSGDVKRSIPVLCHEYCLQEGKLYACSGANILRGVLDTRMNPDTCWIRGYKQIRFEKEYVWKFLNPEGKSCGFKNIGIRVDGVKGCPLGLTIERICMQKSAQFLYSSNGA